MIEEDVGNGLGHRRCPDGGPVTATPRCLPALRLHATRPELNKQAHDGNKYGYKVTNDGMSEGRRASMADLGDGLGYGVGVSVVDNQ